MSKVKVEEINKIDLDPKTWWQPQIDKQTFKRRKFKVFIYKTNRLLSRKSIPIL